MACSLFSTSEKRREFPESKWQLPGGNRNWVRGNYNQHQTQDAVVFHSDLRIQSTEFRAFSLWLMENGIYRQLAAYGSDALREDDFRSAHHPCRIRSPSRLISRRTWSSPIPWCEFSHSDPFCFVSDSDVDLYF